MRRLIVLTFLVLLPLQSIWAAASVYCQHETPSMGMHFGHHDHRHVSDATQDDTVDRLATGEFDNDCAVCHGATVVAILHDAMLTASLVGTIEGRDCLPVQSTSSSLRPERPKWVRLA